MTARSDDEIRAALDEAVKRIEAARGEDRRARTADARTDECDGDDWECHASGAYWGYDHARLIVAALRHVLCDPPVGGPE